MKHDIFRKREDEQRPWNELDRTVDEPETLTPPRNRPLPWRFESGYGWGDSTLALVAKNHDNAKGVEGSNVVTTTRHLDDRTVRYLATAGNYFPEAIDLLKRLVQRRSSHAVTEITADAQQLLERLGIKP